MDAKMNLAAPFEQNRAHLRAVALRMLGSRTEADDAVQEAWLKISRADTSAVENLGGWLTTVVARVCLDMLRSRKLRGEERMSAHRPEAVAGDDVAPPDREVLIADSVGIALLTVLEALAPAERVAFVLHDLFDLSFEEIAPIVGRSSTAVRQLASRARRRVRGGPSELEGDRARQREVVDAFLLASRGGDLSALLAVLDPNVVLTPDRTALDAAKKREAEGAPKLAPETRGAAGVADAFLGRAKAGQPALIDGAVGMVWAPEGTPRAVFAFTIDNGKITAIDLFSDPATVASFDIEIL